MNNVDSKLIGGTEDDQKKLGTFPSNFHALRMKLRQLEELGPDHEAFEFLCQTLLRSFENERLTAERSIKELQRKIEWERARQHSASQHSALVLGILNMTVDKVKDKQPTEVAEPSAVITDTEALQIYCACGCTDDEDAAECDCPCHQGGFCDNPHCVVCPAKKTAAEAAKSKAKKKRSRRPKAKK